MTKLTKLLLVATAVGSVVYFGRPQPARAPAPPARLTPKTAPQKPAQPSAAIIPPLPPGPPTASAPVRVGERTRAQTGPIARLGAGGDRYTPRPEPPAAAAPDLGDELSLLKRARAYVRSNPRRALELSAEHADRFAHGLLGEEREVIAIEALLEQGSKAAALERARAFFATYPGSAHGRRVRTLLDEHGRGAR